MSWLKCRVQDSCHACALSISERIRAQIVSMDGVEAAQNLQGNVLIIGLGWVGVDSLPGTGRSWREDLHH